MNVKTIMRRLNNVLSRGKLLELNAEDSKVPMAKVGLMANEIYDGIEYPQDWGFKSYPPPDCETLTIHFGGNRNHATMIRAFDRNKIPLLESGETVLYNGFGLSLKLNKDNDIIITKEADIDAEESIERTLKIGFNEDGYVTIIATNIILDAPLVTMTGDLLVDGTINGMPIPP